ncbi:MAG: hypothetical protein H6922_03400 [Pseudomonadaceae bacterium]|nr:hypothetical protein [Pseudomonadaceae bacterium]
MDITALPFAVLAYLLGMVLLWHTAGKYLTQLTQPAGTLITLPASLLSGFGMWLLVWLLVVPLGGGDTIVALALFFLLAMAVAAQSLRDWARDKSPEHHAFTLLAMQGLLLLPWAWHVAISPAVEPALLEVLHHAVQAPSSLPPAWQVLLLPAGVPFSPLPPLAAWGLYALMIPLLAALLVQAAGVRIRYSNILWVAAPSLLAALVLAMALGALPLASAPVLLAPVLLLAASLPLLRHEAPPPAIALLPQALMLSVLTLLHPFGLWLALAVAATYVLRGMALFGQPARVIGGASLLACVPLLATALWQITLPVPVCLAPLVAMPFCLSALWDGVVSNLLQWQQLALVCLAVWSTALGLGCLRFGKAGALVVVAPWLGVAAGILVVSPTADSAMALLHLGSGVLMVPCIVWLMHRYQRGRLKNMAFRYPWRMGALVAVPLVAVIIATAPQLAPPPNLMATHAAMVSADIRYKALAPQMRALATIGVPIALSQALGYHLNDAPAVIPLSEEPPDAASLMALLTHTNHNWALLGPGIALKVFALPPPLDATVLVERQDDALLIRAVFPLPVGLAHGGETR